MHGQQQYLGTLDSEAAACAFDARAKALYLNPILNFLPDHSLNPDRKKRGPQYQIVVKEEQDDERTIAIGKEEQKQRPRKRRRRRRASGSDTTSGREEGLLTVAVKEELDLESVGA